jgi:ferric-dicitrate binding protein FerR (iron transport regulator)
MNERELDTLLNGWKDDLKVEQEALAERLRLENAKAAIEARKAAKRAREASRRSRSNEKRIERLEDRVERVADHQPKVEVVYQPAPQSAASDLCNILAGAVVVGVLAFLSLPLIAVLIDNLHRSF